MKLREEFRIRHLKLDGVVQEIYEGDHFKTHSISLLVFRILSFIYLVAMVTIASIANRNEAVFLTSWNYWLVICYFALGLGISVKITLSQRRIRLTHRVEAKRSDASAGASDVTVEYARTQPRDQNIDNVSKLAKANALTYYILQNICINFCFLVTVVFWTLLYRDSSHSRLLIFLAVDRHGVNSLLMLIDFILNLVPIRFLTFLFTDIIIIGYIMLHAVYFTVTSKSPYRVLDYHHNFWLAMSITVLGPSVLIPLSHLLWYFLYRVKMRCRRL